MKWLTLLLALVSSPATAAPVPRTDAAPDELLPNRSFELDANGDGVPDGWGVNAFGTAAKGRLDHETAHRGEC